MKILLSASKKHFDIDKQAILIRHSVGVLVELFYNAIKDLGEITYVSDTDVVQGQEFDLIISWPRNFGNLVSANKHKKSICFFNISEPCCLKRTMLMDAKRLGCKLSDCFTPQHFYHADLNFLIGGPDIKEQYVNRGVPAEKIVEVYYRMNSIPFVPRDKNKRPIFLHVATTLGLRKGFWHVVEDFKKANLDAELWCVGRVQNERFWIDYAKSANTDPRITVFGWIDCATPQYKELLQKADFMVFPSLGEGQAGTVTESMEGGCIPLLSKEVGLPHFPLGEYLRGDISIWQKAFDLPNNEFRRFQDEGQTLLNEKYNNANFTRVVKEAILDLMK